MVTSIIILQVIANPDNGDEWLLQWTGSTSALGGTRHEHHFHSFEDVSRYVEGELLAGEV